MLTIHYFARTIATVCISLTFFLNAGAQEKLFQIIEFKNKSDYKAQEQQIKEMSEYLLSRPVNDNDNRKTAIANVIKWMSGTPDHDFVIDNSIMQLAKNNDAILPLYMASATSAVLSANLALDGNQLKLRSFEILLDYCAQPANGLKADREMKKALAAKAKGSLADYLKI